MPIDPRNRRSMRLSPADYAFARTGCHPITIVYYFEQRQDASVLREALGPALERFYPLQGQLGFDATGRPWIECGESSGIGAIELEERLLEESPELDDHRAMLRFAAPVDTRPQMSLLRMQLLQLPHGSLLSVSMAHVVADGFGYFFFLMTWAAMARGVELPSPQLDRTRLDFGCRPVSAFADDETFEHTRSFLVPADRFDAHREQIEYEELLLRHEFVAAQLAEARRTHSPQLSRNDILTAWLWQRCVRRWHAPGDFVSASCAVDVRRLIEEITPLYFGNAACAAVVRLSYETVVGSSIGELATRIRSAVDALDRTAVEETFRYVEGLHALGLFRQDSALGLRGWDPDTGMIVTNLSRIPLDQLDFGSGGPARFYAVGGSRAAAVFADPAGTRVLLGLRPGDARPAPEIL